MQIAVNSDESHHLRHYGRIAAAYDVLVARAFIFMRSLNERAAQRLQRRIEEMGAPK